MFENKELQQLTQAVRDLITVNQQLLKKIEAQGVLLNTLARAASGDDRNRPAF